MDRAFYGFLVPAYVLSFAVAFYSYSPYKAVLWVTIMTFMMVLIVLSEKKRVDNTGAPRE